MIDRTPRSAGAARGMRPIVLLAVPALALTGFLAGCASHPPHGSTASAARGHGGGYYQNDGPPDDTNIDLAKIPNAVPQNVPLSKFGNPTSYTALGKRYYVLKSAAGFTQTGMASWYGRQFNGGRTSSGAPYNMFSMTAAHKRLPIPSWVRVTNLENGRKVIVKINDRGPFLDNRIIDLSYVAARKLGIVATGSAKVRIRTVTPADYRNTSNTDQSSDEPAVPLRSAANPAPVAAADTPTPASQVASRQYSSSRASSSRLSSKNTPSMPVSRAQTPAHGRVTARAGAGHNAKPNNNQGMMLQIGAFAERSHALELKSRLSRNDLGPVVVVPPTPQLALYLVRLGPFHNLTTRDNIAHRLIADGYEVRQVKR